MATKMSATDKLSELREKFNICQDKQEKNILKNEIVQILLKEFTSKSVVIHVFSDYKSRVCKKGSDDSTDPTNSWKPLATLEKALEIAKPGQYIACACGAESGYETCYLLDHTGTFTVKSHYSGSEWASRQRLTQQQYMMEYSDEYYDWDEMSSWDDKDEVYGINGYIGK